MWHRWHLPRRRALPAAILALVLALALPGLARAAVSTRAPAAPTQPAPVITSPSAVLMEARSGKVLFEKNAHERRHPASVTKIMTLLVAYDAVKQGKVRPEDEVTASAAAARLGGTTAFLQAGEVQTLAALLKAIAVGSANDASVAVAEHVAGSHAAFVEQMNSTAAALGLKNTHFVNAHGFDDPNHYSSAYDLAVIARELVTRHPEVLRLSRIFLDTMRHPDGRETELLNRNRLVRFYNWVDGLKTGWTTMAGYSIAATGEKGGTRMIAVILGSPDSKVRQAESLQLLEYGFAHYTTVTLAAAGQQVGQVAVARGAAEAVAATPARAFAATMPRGAGKKLETVITLAPRVEAPVAAGQVLGEAVATLDGVEVARVPLVAARAVPRLTLWGALTRTYSRLFSLGW